MPELADRQREVDGGDLAGRESGLEVLEFGNLVAAAADFQAGGAVAQQGAVHVEDVQSAHARIISASGSTRPPHCERDGRR